MCDKRHEDQVANDVIVVGGDAASDEMLDRDEDGEAGDELLVAGAENDCI